MVFMKGTPETPQCGFSRAVCQILDVQVGLTWLSIEGFLFRVHADGAGRASPERS